MQDFVIRVTAYHGEPKFASNVPTRDTISQDYEIKSGEVINDFSRRETIIDLTQPGNMLSYSVDDLLYDFESKHHCKVNINDVDKPVNEALHEFDIFEPNWKDVDVAQTMIDKLTKALLDWTHGYPHRSGLT